MTPTWSQGTEPSGMPSASTAQRRPNPSIAGNVMRHGFEYYCVINCCRYCGAGTSACRVENHLDPVFSRSTKRRHECRRGSLRGCATIADEPPPYQAVGARRRMKLRGRDCSRLTTSEIRWSCSSAICSRIAASFTYGYRRMRGCGYCRSLANRFAS